MKKFEFILKDLDCAMCAGKIQTELEKNPKLHNVVVNFAKLKLTYETDEVSVDEVKKVVKEIEPEVEMLENSGNQGLKEENSKLIFQVIRLIVGMLIALIGMYANLLPILGIILTLIGYTILLYRTARKAIMMLLKNKKINENFLITISCIGAYAVGEHMEGLMVIVLYEIGKILEEKSVRKSRKSIQDLMNIKPEYANLKVENEIRQVEPETVKIGDIILVKKGERVPLDGIVIRGRADLNTASLTGESKLVQVQEGKQVLSGSIVVDGMLEIKVTEEYENSTVSRILDLVENATDKKAKTETFVNKASAIYTPIVLGLAMVVAIFLPMFTSISYTGDNGSIYRALIFLVISCPCSIAISVPLSYFAGIGKSSKEGILIKGSDYIDAIKDIKEIVFDKTGTLTKGEFEIVKIEALEGYSEKEVLEYAAIGEKFSNHPIAKAIVKAMEESLQGNENGQEEFARKVANVQNFKEIAGKGISFGDRDFLTFSVKRDRVEEKETIINHERMVFVGNGDEDAKNKSVDGAYTKVYVKIDDTLIGIISLGDKVKEEARGTIKQLKALGIRTSMFTGDNKEVAEKIGNELEIENIKSEMLPQDKYDELEEILRKNSSVEITESIKSVDTDGKINDAKKEKIKGNAKVAFVGDGINDSPVLARADVGISMGGVGQESAIEASDVVIMTDNISKILEAIKISKKTCRIIKQNLTFSIGVKLLILVLSVVGFGGMWQAVFADVGVTVLTIFNTFRIGKIAK